MHARTHARTHSLTHSLTLAHAHAHPHTAPAPHTRINSIFMHKHKYAVSPMSDLAVRRWHFLTARFQAPPGAPHSWPAPAPEAAARPCTIREREGDRERDRQTERERARARAREGGRREGGREEGGREGEPHPPLESPWRFACGARYTEQARAARRHQTFNSEFESPPQSVPAGISVAVRRCSVREEVLC